MPSRKELIQIADYRYRCPAAGLTDRQTDRRTDRDRQRQIETDRQADRQTDRDRLQIASRGEIFI